MKSNPASLHDLPLLLSKGMGTDLHWFPEDVSLTRLAETMVGMANGSGGQILLGVSPRSNRVVGIRQAEKLVDLVFQAALLADPSLVIPIPAPLKVEGKQVLLVTIPAGLPNVYSLGGRYFERAGRHTAPIPARRLRRLLVERGITQFESQVPPHASLDDLDPDQVEAYSAEVHLPGDEPPEQLLLRRGCLIPEGDALRPTYAALLLFGRRPQRWLPSATILAARFTGPAFGDQFIKQEISGTLPQQLRLADQFVRDNLRSTVRMVGLTRQESLDYPPEAVRELLVNAVAHRDYNTQGDCIHLHIFSDRLEIHSPGRLPGPVNLSNLLTARFSRNAVIVQVLSDLGFVERLGYGLNRVMQVVEQNSLPPPQFGESAGTFRVTLFKAAEPDQSLPDLSEYSELGLNPRQELAIRFLASRRRITNRAYQELCPEVHPETLRRDLADLVKRGVLIKIGDKRATYYIFKKS